MNWIHRGRTIQKFCGIQATIASIVDSIVRYRRFFSTRDASAIALQKLLKAVADEVCNVTGDVAEETGLDPVLEETDSSKRIPVAEAARSALPPELAPAALLSPLRRRMNNE